MPHRVIRVTTPSRLHFGLFSFGPREPCGSPTQLAPTAGPERTINDPLRRFGGVGAMIARPGISLKVTPAERLEVSGPLAARAAHFARRAAAASGVAVEPACRIEIESAPREHIGLGTGTQLGLAVAAAVQAFFGRVAPLPAELARGIGRGERSAIGTHGFATGGLLIEAGKRRAKEVSPLVARADLPETWRFLLLLPREAVGLSGDDERQAFAGLPPVPRATTEALAAEALLHLLPAAIEADFAAFSRSLYRFGHTAGNCFAARQEGAFHDRQAAELVEQLRQWGVEGVGQSSWGPTLFALLPDELAAQSLAIRLKERSTTDGYDCLITAPDNQGAHLDIEIL